MRNCTWNTISLALQSNAKQWRPKYIYDSLYRTFHPLDPPLTQFYSKGAENISVVVRAVVLKSSWHVPKSDSTWIRLETWLWNDSTWTWTAQIQLLIYAVKSQVMLWVHVVGTCIKFSCMLSVFLVKVD